MITLDILRRAREFLSERERWCQGADFIMADGKAWSYEKGHVPLDPAQCCLEGACILSGAKVTGITHTDTLFQAGVHGVLNMLNNLVGENNLLPPFKFNDTHTYEEVLALLDQAIAKLEAQQ